MLAALVGTVFLFGLTVAGLAAFYYACVYALRVMSRLPGVRRVVSVHSKPGSDTFKFSVGSLFGWSVAVNPQKGALAGSIQVNSGRWPVLAALVAVLVALTLPAVSGIVIPAAIVVVAIAVLRKPAAK